MGSPEIDVPHIPAASLCCHLEELLLYQNSHWSLLFQGDNFVIKKWFVILRLGKQAYEGGKKFIWRDSNNSWWGVLLPWFCFTERARIWHELKFFKANLSGIASFCSLPLKIDCLCFIHLHVKHLLLLKWDKLEERPNEAVKMPCAHNQKLVEIDTWQNNLLSFPKPCYVSISDCLCWLIIYPKSHWKQLQTF